MTLALCRHESSSCFLAPETLLLPSLTPFLACAHCHTPHLSHSPGDFWDRRGDLPVIPLNTIHSEMSSWGDTPLLMLSGNHDQVSLTVLVAVGV